MVALKVDEMDQMVEEVAMRTVITTAHLAGEERLAGRKQLADDPDSIVHFWIGKINDRLAESDSGFAIGDSLTIADLRCFLSFAIKLIKLFKIKLMTIRPFGHVHVLDSSDETWHRIFCELTAATSGWYDGFGSE